MNKKINAIRKLVLEKINPSKKDLRFLEDSVKEFKKNIETQLKKQKISAEIFVGGSFAKKTIIKKYKYDVDIFIRFDKKYDDEKLSGLTKKILEKTNKKFERIHGSRDYFRIKISSNFFIELVPVRKIKTPKEAQNITDLSYSHVNFIRRKIKSQKILDDIKIAKAFCHANNCYGAESYIRGFSGYALELLIYYYKGFYNFLKAISKINSGEKVIIDIAKFYKTKQRALMDMNSSKLNSLIILIDPTFKQRNALAALSKETFEKFQKAAKKFLEKPSEKFFEKQEIDIKKIKQNSKKNKSEFILARVKTNKQKGDVAGTKLLKFYNFLSKEIFKFFKIINQGFIYNNKNYADYFFVVKPKKQIVFQGPFVGDKKNLQKFKKQHKKTFVKSKRIYAREKINFNLETFLKNWKTKNKKLMRDMGISGMVIED